MVCKHLRVLVAVRRYISVVVVAVCMFLPDVSLPKIKFQSINQSVNHLLFSYYLYAVERIGTLNPALYSADEANDFYDIPSGHVGRVWFSVEYDRQVERLTVTLIKARNLPLETIKADIRASPDSFARFDSDLYQSSIHKLINLIIKLTTIHS